MNLEGKVALVTGASAGIGRATAIALGNEGAKVVVAARRREQGEETVATIRSCGGQAVFVATDVSKRAEVEALVSRAVETSGRLNLACNNAAIPGPHLVFTADFPEEDWDKVIGTNLTGVWRCSDAASFVVGHALVVDGGFLSRCGPVVVEGVDPGHCRRCWPRERSEGMRANAGPDRPEATGTAMSLPAVTVIRAPADSLAAGRRATAVHADNRRTWIPGREVMSRRGCGLQFRTGPAYAMPALRLARGQAGRGSHEITREKR